MVEHYRQRAVHCPGCGAFLASKPGEGSPDADLLRAPTGARRCEHCGGLWVDWFAGDVLTLLRAMPPFTEQSAPPVARAAEAVGRCPRCGEALHASTLPQTVSLTAWSCGRCGGRFLALPTLLALGPEGAPEEGAPWWSPLTLWLGRALEGLRRVQRALRAGKR